MKLYNFIMFCLILAGANILMIVFSIAWMYGPDGLAKATFNQWAGLEHTFLIMFLLGVDTIATAVYFLNNPPKDKRSE